MSSSSRTVSLELSVDDAHWLAAHLERLDVEFDGHERYEVGKEDALFDTNEAFEKAYAALGSIYDEVTEALKAVSEG